ncbi:unnamed protein product [Mesocestoides corti]|nr:unnamed protein product [Mesocestoides corti]
MDDCGDDFVEDFFADASDNTKSKRKNPSTNLDKDLGDLAYDCSSKRVKAKEGFESGVTIPNQCKVKLTSKGKDKCRPTGVKRESPSQSPLVSLSTESRSPHKSPEKALSPPPLTDLPVLSSSTTTASPSLKKRGLPICVTPSTGLRLGLSRRNIRSSLHPNVKFAC